MNKSFKVVFNKTRGALMVVNEVTSSVQAKGTKTVIAATVSTLVAGVAVAGLPADPITNTNLPTNLVTGQSTSKLISGQGVTIDIETKGNVGQLLEDLNIVSSTQGTKPKLEAIMKALGPHNGSTIITGVTGGWNLMDKQTAITVALGSAVNDELPEGMFDKLLGQFNYEGLGQGDYEGLEQGGYFGNEGNVFTQNGDTNIKIGESPDSNPLVLGVVGGDLYLSLSKAPAQIKHEGTATVSFHNGNAAGVVGGSVISNSGYSNSSIDKVEGSFASVQKTQLNILDSANVGGFVSGGLAIASQHVDATSSVVESTNVLIDTNPEAAKLDGLVIGGFGGGLALATGDAKANVVNGTKTNITVKNGEVLGLFGGGAALSGDVYLDTTDPKLSLIQQILIGEGSGSATSSSGDITINLNDKSATSAVIGGGFAFADACKTNVGTSKAFANSVILNLEGKSALTAEEKSKLHNAANVFLKKVKDKNVGINDFADFAAGVNVDGAHIGNLGGGLAFARGYFENPTTESKGSATANSEISNQVTLNLNGGYNVGTAAGGIAIGLDKGGNADEQSSQINAKSLVNKAVVNITGGENILVTAGGLSYAKAESDGNTHVKADAEVKEAEVLVTNGSVDGLFGGGIAIDATGVGITNATASSTKVELTVSGGEVYVANLDPITGLIVGVKEDTPTRGSYVYQTAKLVKAANAAIVGGGLATGSGALANVETVNIALNGGKINGNVVAGGAATLGAKSNVTTANIEINGAEVTGDVYGGGLAGSPDNNKFNKDYNAPTSNVENTTITLKTGSLDGDVYLGGFLNGGKQSVATSSVGTGIVKLDGAFNFKGNKIDGSGAKTSHLVVTGDVDLAKKDESATPLNIVIGGFDTINGEQGSLKNAVFDFGTKVKTTITGGQFDFVSVNDGQDKIMTLDKNAAVAITGTAANNFVVTNGVLGLGTDAKAKDAAVAKASQATDAALYLSGTVNLDGKNISVGTTDKTGVVIGKNGTLIVDATVTKDESANDTSNPVTTVTGKVDHEEGAKLHFVNVADQGVVKVDIDIQNITVDNVLFEATEGADQKYTFGVVKDQGKLNNLGIGDFNTGALQQIAGQKDEASKFINGFLNGQAGVALSGSDRNAKLKSAFNLGAAAGVQTAGIDSALMGIDEATKRASLTNVFNDGWTGFASVTGNQLKFGDSSDTLETKTKLAGVAVGGEYTMGDMTFGALGHFGSGDVKGQGRNSGVKNDVDYYGFQAYAAKRINQFNIVGQLGYVMTENDITHDVGQSTKVDADVFTMGVRGEMNYAINDTWNAVPYVGLNWLRVSTDAYTTNKGIRVDSTDQDLINMPIGVAISGDCSNVAGWTVRPVVDVAYVHTFGDTDLDATSHVGEATMGTTLDVWSENVGRFSVGAEARNGNMGFGFKLGGAKGDGGHEEFFGQLNAKYVF